MIPMAYQQHIEARDLAINRLVDMYFDDYDITNREIFNATLARYGLIKDGFCSEEGYIIQEVVKKINKRLKI